MFKATEVETKIREINLLIDMQINLSFVELQTIIFCCLSSYCLLSWELLVTKNVSSAHAQNFWKVNKSWRQKRCESLRVYPPEMIQTSSLELN